MKITIRTRILKTGSRSIYLDFYEKGKRWIEYLNLFLVPDDAPDARRLNEAAHNWPLSKVKYPQLRPMFLIYHLQLLSKVYEKLALFVPL